MKVAAITGAYSGLGESLSSALAKKGWNLVLSGRDKGKLKLLQKQIEKLTDCTMVVADVRRKSDCDNLIKTAINRFGCLDLLINNAGVWKADKIEDAKEADIREMFETNVMGPIFCSQAAMGIMKKQNSGHILNIGSTAAVDLKTSHVAYGSSKAALIAFTACLISELKDTNIRVSVFSPGGMKTNLFRSKPERRIEGFMEPDFVAEKIIQHIEKPTGEWHIILKK